MPTDIGAWDRLRDFSRQQLLPHRHSALLVALVAAFAVRPVIGDVGFSPIAFSIALILLMLVSLYTIQVDELVGEREILVTQKKRRRKIGWLLAIPAPAERIAITVVRAHYIIVTGMLSGCCFSSTSLGMNFEPY